MVALQRRFHLGAVPPEAQAREGFVFTTHTEALLARMAALLPQAVALDDGRVVGYCLALHPSLRAEQPLLAPMFEAIERAWWRGAPLAGVPFFVGGQVCVDAPWRRQGLMGRLYGTVAREVGDAWRACVTEVAARNGPSLRAHLTLGFEEVARYDAGGETWVIVAWPLERAT